MGINVVWPGIEPVQNATCLDINLLMSVAEQPYQECFGCELYPSLAAKAAYIFCHLASGHVFSNGNKRTAAIALDQFVLTNTHYLTLSNEQVHDLAQSVASAGERGQKFADMLPKITALTCIIHEGTASGCWEREDAGGSVILVAWPCC